MKKLLLSFCALLYFTAFIYDEKAFASSEIVQLNEGYSSSNSNEGIFSNSSSFTSSSFSCGEELITDELDDEIETYKKEEANMAEKFLTSQVQNIIHIGDLNGLSTLIFGNPYCVWGGNSDNNHNATMSSNGIFTEQEQETIIKPLMKLLGSIFFLLLVLAMLISGIKLGMNSVRGQALGEFGEDFRMWGLALGLALGYDMITNVIFQMNAAVVLSIRDLITNSGNSLNQISLIYDFHALHAVMGMGPFLLLMLAEWILALILNFVYLARKVVILILMVMGLLAIYSLLFAKTRAFFGTWLKEFVGNVFLQSIHSLVLYTMVMFAAAGSSSIFKLGLLMMFIPISGMISKWLNIGDSSSKLGSSLTMVGLGGIMSTMMLASQAGNIIRGGSLLGGNSSATSMDGGTSVNSPISNLANSLANDTGNTAITTSASGANSSIWNTGKDIAGKAGMILGGAAGLVAGPVGSVLGAKAGKAVAENALQMARNIPAGATNVVSSIQQGMAFSNGQEQGFRAMFSSNDANALMARRETFANIGESLGSMLGVRAASVGRSIGAGLSGVSRERLADMQSVGMGLVNPETGQPMALSFEQLASKFPNADAKWVQSNQGSAMFVNTPDGWQQVGLSGAADTSLKEGEFRSIDYKLADPSLSYELQQNGTYRTPALDGNTLANINNDSIPSFSEAMGGDASSFLQNNPVVAASTMSDYVANNASVGATTLGDLASSNSAMRDMSPSVLAFNNQGLQNVTFGSIAQTNESIGNAQASTFFESNPGIAQSLGVDVSNTSSLGAMSVNDYVTNNPSVSSISMSDMFISGSSLSNATVGDFLQENPSIGNVSMDDFASSMGPTTVESFSTSNPELASAVIGAHSEPMVMGTSNHRMETVGLSGSSESLFRTSGAYISGGIAQNAEGAPTISSHVNAGVVQHISNNETPRYQDTNFRADSVNPDAFLFHNPHGASRATGSDRLANVVHKGGEVKSQWVSKFNEQIAERRSKKIV